MSDLFEIRYLKTAEKDMEEVFNYILKDNPTAAISMLNKFDQAISQLAYNPKLGVIPKDDRLRKLNYRMLIVEKYLVFYVIKKKSIQIRRVIHGARRYKHLI